MIEGNFSVVLLKTMDLIPWRRTDGINCVLKILFKRRFAFITSKGTTNSHDTTQGWRKVLNHHRGSLKQALTDLFPELELEAHKFNRSGRLP
jgi:hypothetical protein